MLSTSPSSPASMGPHPPSGASHITSESETSRSIDPQVLPMRHLLVPKPFNPTPVIVTLVSPPLSPSDGSTPLTTHRSLYSNLPATSIQSLPLKLVSNVTFPRL
eukprot:27322-Hanusia_phi.AAC.2